MSASTKSPSLPNYSELMARYRRMTEMTSSGGVGGATTSSNAGAYTVPLGTRARKKRSRTPMLKRVSPGLITISGLKAYNESISESAEENPMKDPPYKAPELKPELVKAIAKLRKRYKLKVPKKA